MTEVRRETPVLPKDFVPQLVKALGEIAGGKYPKLHLDSVTKESGGQDLRIAEDLKLRALIFGVVGPVFVNIAKEYLGANEEEVKVLNSVYSSEIFDPEQEENVGQRARKIFENYQKNNKENFPKLKKMLAFIGDVETTATVKINTMFGSDMVATGILASHQAKILVASFFKD